MTTILNHRYHFNPSTLFPRLLESPRSVSDATSRSSNIAEGWKSGFTSLVNCNNPSIWKFLDGIKREQALTDVKITNILTRRPFKRAAKWEEFDLEIQCIVDDY